MKKRIKDDVKEQVLNSLQTVSYTHLVDVLKVGHHGSKGSSSDVFLDQLHPQLALISVGKKNRYQHPHKELLDRLEAVSYTHL